jgi:hypothetical protein
MGKITGVLVFLLVAIVQLQAALAQPDVGTSCPQCRAIAHFRTCERPQDGARTIRGRVIGVRNGPCSQVLSLDVSRASEQGLPARLAVDLGPCAFWAGKAGDVIDVAVLEAQVPANNVYSLACRLW